MATVIYVKSVDCKTKDGKQFKAFETTDKNGNKVNVRFTKDIVPPIGSCYIALLDYWQDKRKAYPTIRVAKYEEVEAPEKTRHTDIEF